VRGLPAYRLRDRSLLLLQAEYRWQANPFIAGAIFYDAGTVAPGWRALDLGALEQDAGIGVRIGWMSNAALRADLAFGAEGPRLALKFSNVF
jgi:outer membrane translocation and assembly module TamA